MLFCFQLVWHASQKSSDDATHIVNAPENRDVCPLSIRGRVRRHDGTLAGPEDAGADSEDCTGDNSESLVLLVVVVEEWAGVEDVGGAGGEEGKAGAEDVVDAAAEDAEDSEGGEEGGGGVVGGSRIDPASAAHAGEGVVHARAAETDQSDETHLNKRRVVPEFRLGHLRASRFFHSFHTHIILIPDDKFNDFLRIWL